MTAAKWTGACAVHRGRSHVKAGMPCQDAAGVLCSGLPVIAAVADGMGSAARSDVGAQIAIQAATTMLSDSFKDFCSRDPDLVAEALVHGIRDQIARVANSTATPLREFATTLMFVATDGNTLVSGSLGDGVVTRQGQGGRSTVLMAPRRGEHANETYPVTSVDAHRQMQVIIEPIGEAQGFALFTDGSAESLFQRNTGIVAPAVDTMLSWLDVAPSARVADALATSLADVVGEKTSDDCSVALIRRVHPSMVAAESVELRAELLAANPKMRVHFANRLRALEHWEKRSVGCPVGMARETYRLHRKWLSRHLTLQQ